MKKAIDKSGMNRSQLGESSGVDPAQISYFMSGQRSLTLKSAEKIADVLGLELAPKKSRKRG